MKKFKRYLKDLRHKLRLAKTQKLSAQLVGQLKEILPQCTDIPVIIVSYNNGIYVKNTCDQLEKYNIKPIIIDNNSNDKNTLDTIKVLADSDKAFVAYSSYNFGHEVGFIEPVYKLLPDVFAYTDPDLQYNNNLPKDFLNTLSYLTIKYSVFKAGFALALDIGAEMKDTTFHSCHYKPIFFEKTLTIKEFESKYWRNLLQHDELELYASPIDTTFAVYRKRNYTGDFHSAIRVAGDFSATHLPWYVELDLMNDNDRAIYNKNNTSSNWS